MENKPINSEAFGYVRLHVSEKVNLDDFVIIEKLAQIIIYFNIVKIRRIFYKLPK